MKNSRKWFASRRKSFLQFVSDSPISILYFFFLFTIVITNYEALSNSTHPVRQSFWVSMLATAVFSLVTVVGVTIIFNWSKRLNLAQYNRRQTLIVQTYVNEQIVETTRWLQVLGIKPETLYLDNFSLAKSNQVSRKDLKKILSRKYIGNTADAINARVHPNTTKTLSFATNALKRYAPSVEKLNLHFREIRPYVDPRLTNATMDLEDVLYSVSKLVNETKRTQANALKLRRELKTLKTMPNADSKKITELSNKLAIIENKLSLRAQQLARLTCETIAMTISLYILVYKLAREDRLANYLGIL